MQTGSNEVRSKAAADAADCTQSAEALARVGRHWGAHRDDFCRGRHWTELPAVKARINSKITGDPNVDEFAYVIDKYFLRLGRRVEKCLSLGSGAGELERGLTKYIAPKKHVAIEISEDLVRASREQAAGFPHIEYRQADLNTCALERDEYDLVIAHQSLHHVLNLEGLLERVRYAMRPYAVFLFDEYVGPRRFQWTDRQIECINGIIQLLPETLNRDPQTGIAVGRFSRPTPEQVMGVDPSEAIRSDDILPLVRRNLRIAELHPYGGTILHMLLHLRAANFFAEEARPWLDLLFTIEDLLLPELGSDFASVICT